MSKRDERYEISILNLVSTPEGIQTLASGWSTMQGEITVSMLRKNDGSFGPSVLEILSKDEVGNKLLCDHWAFFELLFKPVLKDLNPEEKKLYAELQEKFTQQTKQEEAISEAGIEIRLPDEASTSPRLFVDRKPTASKEKTDPAFRGFDALFGVQ